MIALEARRGARLAREPLDQGRKTQGLRQHELEGHLLIELKVRRRHDDPHAAQAQDSVDAVLARKDVTLRKGERPVRWVLHGVAHGW